LKSPKKKKKKSKGQVENRKEKDTKVKKPSECPQFE
jgi:hypothetical protein